MKYFGHELMGVVEDVGSAVTRLRKGDRVVVPFTIACGQADTKLNFLARSLVNRIANIPAEVEV